MFMVNNKCKIKRTQKSGTDRATQHRFSQTATGGVCLVGVVALATSFHAWGGGGALVGALKGGVFGW